MLKVLKELSGSNNSYGHFGPEGDEPVVKRSAEHMVRDKEGNVVYEDDGDANEHDARKKKRDTPKFILLHYSPFKAVWDWIIQLLVLYTAVVTPLVAAFFVNEDQTRRSLNQDSSTRLRNADISQADPLVMIDLIVDIMFIADILINFRTTYIVNGETVMNPQKIAVNYVKGWFAIDALAAIPFDLLLFGTGSSETMKITGFLKTARLLRLLRVIKRMDQYSEYGAATMLMLMCVFALAAHWLACIFYAISYNEQASLDEPISWLDKLAVTSKMPYLTNDSMSGPDVKTKYITALYFTLTSITSIGFGNVAANTNNEKIFSICAMLLGCLISAAIFGNVSSIMLRLYQGSQEYQDLKGSIKEFIKFHKIPKGLAQRLSASHDDARKTNKGVNISTVLKIFPDCLQADICLHLNRQLLENCAAFKEASPGCLRALSTRFKSTHAPPGDTLLHPGDILDSIYFIARGSVEILKDTVVMAILGKDDIFGENLNETTLKDRRSIGKSNFFVRALSYCDLHKIKLEDLHEILHVYPEFAGDFLRTFRVTFNLRHGDFIQRASAGIVDDETLKFIRQKRPRLQCRGSIRSSSSKTEDCAAVPIGGGGGGIGSSLRRRLGKKAEEEKADQGSDLDDPRIIKPARRTITSRDIIEMSPSMAYLPDYSEMEERVPPIEEYSETAVVPDRRKSGRHGYPAAGSGSSSSCAPRSAASSGGPVALPGGGQGQWDVEFQAGEPCGLHSLGDIDQRLSHLQQRMNVFEDNLCSTVDAILEVLGHSPSVVRQQYCEPQRTSVYEGMAVRQVTV